MVTHSPAAQAARLDYILDRGAFPAEHWDLYGLDVTVEVDALDVIVLVAVLERALGHAAHNAGRTLVGELRDRLAASVEGQLGQAMRERGL
jgi:hypothetical protein